MIRVLLVVTLALAAVSGCAASSSEVRTARAARYTADDTTVIVAITEALKESRYAVAGVEGRTVVSNKILYRENGTPLRGAVSRDIRSSSVERTFSLAFEVRVVDGGTGRAVEIIPHVVLHATTGIPQKLPPSSPAVPPWVGGQADALHVRIHRRLADQVAPPPPAGGPPATQPIANAN